MALSLGTTAGTLGFATAVADIVVWRYNGHPLPVPDDVVAAFSVAIGVGTHAIGIAASWAGNILNQVIQKKLGLPTGNPQQPGQ